MQNGGSSVMWVEDTLTDSVLGAMQECIRAAHDAAVGHAADLSSVLGRINELFREHDDPGAGYWQVRASSAETSSVVFEVLLGERLPGGAAISSKVPLSSEAGSGDGSAVSATGPPPVGKWRGREEAEAGPKTADRYQRIPPSGIRERVRPDRVSITDDGRVVLIRCHAGPQPEHATDDDMTTLTSLCQWLHEQCHQIASGSAVDFASSMTAGQRAKLRGAELSLPTTQNMELVRGFTASWLPGLTRPLGRGNQNCIPGLTCRRLQRTADPGPPATTSTTSGLQAASPLMLPAMRVQHQGRGMRHGNLCPSASRTTAATGRADLSTGDPRDPRRAGRRLGLAGQHAQRRKGPITFEGKTLLATTAHAAGLR
jgi:hypothetical protein